MSKKDSKKNIPKLWWHTQMGMQRIQKICTWIRTETEDGLQKGWGLKHVYLGNYT